MSAGGGGAPGSNSQLLEQVTSNFIAAAAAECYTTNADILVCDLADVVVYHCSGTISCGNTANVTTTTCDSAGVAKALLAAFDKAVVSPSQLQDMVTITTPLDGENGTPQFDPTDPASVAAAYVTSRCFVNTYARQAVGFPNVLLQDCGSVTVTGLNTLDEKTRCAVGALSELIPPEPVFLGGPKVPLPIWQDPVHLTLVVCGAAILIALLLGVGIYLKARDYNPMASAQVNVTYVVPAGRQ